MTELEVERLLARRFAELRRELALETELAVAELRAEINRELAAITTRIDSVHTNALRELTRRLETRR